MPSKKYTLNPPVVRKLLKEFPDGLSTKEISEKTSMAQDTLYRVLHNMPDTYIDRWVYLRKYGGAPTAIWCIVEVPENCPRQQKSAKRLSHLNNSCASL